MTASRFAISWRWRASLEMNEYRQLVKQLDRLVDEVGEEESRPLASMVEVIGVLIEKYED